MTLLLNFSFKIGLKYFHEDEKVYFDCFSSDHSSSTAHPCRTLKGIHYFRKAYDFFFSLVKQLLVFHLPYPSLFFSADEALLKESNPQTTRLLIPFFPMVPRACGYMLVGKEEKRESSAETLHPQSQ